MLLSLSCKAQNPVVSIDETYFKDLNNELNKFTCMWKYASGNTEFIIELAKLEQFQIGNMYHVYLI